MWCLRKKYIADSKEDRDEVICVTFWDKGKQSYAETRKRKEES
jgi:hypothetical protein